MKTYSEALKELRYKPLEACAMAGDMIKSAGFKLATVSMHSEACYYHMPGRYGLIRVATHTSSNDRYRHRHGLMEQWGPIISRITFNDHGGAKLTRAYIEQHAASAIGLFLIRTSIPT